MDELKAMKAITRKRGRRDAGITMIETLLAASILAIGSLGMMGLVVGSIATNNRNKIDSTQTMLAESIVEQINATFNGTGTSSLKDCAGTAWTIDTTIPNTGDVGAALSGANIDWTETSPPAGYHMTYVVSTKCNNNGALLGTYDLRWHLKQIGSSTTYLITVGAKLLNHGEGNMYFSLPVTLRMMSGS